MSPDSEEVDHNLLRRPSVLKDVKSVFPNQIHGAGLSAERQWYLFEEIGPFFYSEVARRAVCPEPTTPKTCKTIKYAEKNQTKVNTDRKQVKGHAQTDSSDKTKRKRKCQDWPWVVSCGVICGLTTIHNVHCRISLLNCYDFLLVVKK